MANQTIFTERVKTIEIAIGLDRGPDPGHLGAWKGSVVLVRPRNGPYATDGITVCGITHGHGDPYEPLMRYAFRMLLGLIDEHRDYDDITMAVIKRCRAYLNENMCREGSYLLGQMKP